MKKIYFLLGFILFSAFLSGCKLPSIQTDKTSCNSDTDCVCQGIDLKTGSCFIGNKEYYSRYVNKEQDCPDFCTGIAEL
jgi:hypothetical protein